LCYDTALLFLRKSWTI